MILNKNRDSKLGSQGQYKSIEEPDHHGDQPIDFHVNVNVYGILGH